MALMTQSWRGWSPSRLNRERVQQRASGYYCWIDLSAFLILIWALLMIEMAAQPAITYGSPVNFARVGHSTWQPQALREDSMHLAIDLDSNVYFGITKTTPNDLPAQIREGVRGGAEKRVYLDVDARARYGNVKLVLDELRAAGITNVTFVVEASAPTH